MEVLDVEEDHEPEPTLEERLAEIARIQQELRALEEKHAAKEQEARERAGRLDLTEEQQTAGMLWDRELCESPFESLQSLETTAEGNPSSTPGQGQGAGSGMRLRGALTEEEEEASGWFREGAIEAIGVIGDIGDIGAIGTPLVGMGCMGSIGHMEESGQLPQGYPLGALKTRASMPRQAPRAIIIYEARRHVTRSVSCEQEAQCHHESARVWEPGPEGGECGELCLIGQVHEVQDTEIEDRGGHITEGYGVWSDAGAGRGAGQAWKDAMQKTTGDNLTEVMSPKMKKLLKKDQSEFQKWAMPIESRKNFTDNSEDWVPPDRSQPWDDNVEPAPGQNSYWATRNNALGLFGPDHPVRIFAGRLVRHSTFETIVMASIAGSSLLMAVERPAMKDDSFEAMLLQYGTLVFVTIFSVEFWLKCIAEGMFRGPDAYFTDEWNRLDGGLVFLSWIDLLLDYVLKSDSSLVRMLRVLRITRALRPLRSVHRIPSLKTVVRTILTSVEPISQLVLLFAVIFTVFGILSVQLFSGKLYHCESASGVSHNVTTKEHCSAYWCHDCRWVNQPLHFDNILQASVTVFFVTMGDGWMEIMYTGIDAVGKDMQPQRDTNMLGFIFFFMVVLIGQFILLNMFIGVVVSSYSRQSVVVGTGSEDDDLDSDATAATKIAMERRQKWLDAQGQARLQERRAAIDLENAARDAKRNQLNDQIAVLRLQAEELSKEGDIDGMNERLRLLDDLTEEVEDVKHVDVEQTILSEFLEEPGNRWCGLCYSLVTHEKFDVYISVVILLNVLIMSLEHYNQPDWMTVICTYANLGFTGFFLMEALIKLFALGCVEYWASGWNCFDALVVMVSCGSIYIEMFSSGINMTFNPTLLRILRVFRIARLLRVFNVSIGLKVLLTTVAQALPSIMNVALVLFMLFYIYACAGVEMFGKQGCGMSPCEGLSRHCNFKDWPYAMLTLFQVCTGDNGVALLKDMMREEPDCSDELDCEENCCTPGGRVVATLFFVSFAVASRLVLLNIVVAILMVQLKDANEEALLIAIASQCNQLDDLEGEELLKVLGMDASELNVETEMHSAIMVEKRRLDAADSRKGRREVDRGM